MNEALILVEDLKKYFPLSGKTAVRAVDGLSFNVKKGETLGLVGESGCGKTTTGRLILRLLLPTSGRIYFEGKDLSSLRSHEMRRLRQKMQIVFQDPYSSLNPRMTTGSILSFPMRVHNLYRGNRRKRVSDLLQLVGMSASDANRYPHEFSGGQLQRIGIARALAVDPTFIVTDEPVSALDVSIQSQILNLFKELQTYLNLTYVFISHDLSVVEFISDRIAVLYLGKMVELAPAKQLYKNAYHPYTKSLIAAIPLPDPEIEQKKRTFKLEGEVPSPIAPPTGCRFHPRCSEQMDVCTTQEPALRQVAPEHYAACHLYSNSTLMSSSGNA